VSTPHTPKCYFEEARDLAPARMKYLNSFPNYIWYTYLLCLAQQAARPLWHGGGLPASSALGRAYTLHSQPQIPNPKPQTPNLEPQILNPNSETQKAETSNPKPQTPDTKPQNPEPRTLNPKP